MYGEYRASLNGKSITDNDVENILRTSTDNNELKAVWESHKGIGRVVEKELIELVKMRNQVAQSLGFDASTCPCIELSEEEALVYLRGGAPDLSAYPKGYAVMTCHGFPLGFVKNLGNRCNNLHPQSRRIRMDINR